MKRSLTMFAILTVFIIFLTGNIANAKPPEPKEIKPYAEDWYVTPEDIIRDIVFPAIDKRVTKDYGNINWQQQRILGYCL